MINRNKFQSRYVVNEIIINLIFTCYGYPHQANFILQRQSLDCGAAKYSHVKIVSICICVSYGRRTNMQPIDFV